MNTSVSIVISKMEKQIYIRDFIKENRMYMSGYAGWLYHLFY